MKLGLLIPAVSLSLIGSAALGAGCGGDSLGGNGRLLDGGYGTGGRGGAPGTGGSGGTEGGVTARVGQKCAQTADCAGGLVCLTSASSDLISGGPPHGLCTADCSADFVQNTDTCGPLDPNSACIAFNPTGSVAFCLERCTMGVIPAGAVKCGGRTDMACVDSGFGGNTGTCTPTCRGDFDCAAPRVCDLSSGLCTDPANIQGALLLGSACSTAASPDPCRGGFCISTGTGAGVCTGFCTLGTAGCGESPTATRLDAFCLLSTDPTFFDAGDQGYCAQLCDCDGDCRASGYVCAAVEPLVQQSSGRHGYCTQGGVGVVGTACPAADGGPG